MDPLKDTDFFYKCDAEGLEYALVDYFLFQDLDSLPEPLKTPALKAQQILEELRSIMDEYREEHGIPES
jgi:hypothetical protein